MKNKLVNIVKQHKLLTVLLVILLAVGVIVAFSKYKDQKNAATIKTLHADVISLRNKLNSESVREFKAIGVCGSGPVKFSDAHSCNVAILYSSETPVDEEYKAIIQGQKTEFGQSIGEYCDFLSARGYTNLGERGDFFNCSIEIREANIDYAKDLFEQL